MTRRKRFRLLRSSILAASVWAVPVNAQYVVGAGYVSGPAPQVTHSLLVSSSDAADPTGLTGGRALLAAVAASKISGQSIQLVPDSVGGFFNLGGTANPSVTVTNNLVLPDGVSLNGNWPVTLGIGGTATIIPISSMSESGTLGTLTLTSAATFTSTQEAIVWSALNTATFLQTGFNGIWPVSIVAGTGGTVCTYPLNVSGLSADTTSTAACLILNNGGCIIGNSNGDTATASVSAKVGSIVATGNNCQVSNLSIVGTMVYGMSSFPLGEILATGTPETKTTASLNTNIVIDNVQVASWNNGPMFYAKPAANSTLAASNILMRRVFAVSNKDGFHLYSSTKIAKTPWSVSIDDCDIHSYANLRFSGWQVGYNNADSVTNDCGFGGSIQISGSNLNCIAGSSVNSAGAIQPGGTLSTVTVRSSLLYCLDNNLSGTLFGPVSNIGGQLSDGQVQISPDCLFNPYSMTSSSFIGVAVGAQSQIFGSGPPTLTQTSAVGSSGTCSIVGSLNDLNTDSDKAVSLSLVPSGTGLASGVFAYLTLAATAGNTPSAIRAIIQDDNPAAGITASDFAIGQIASGSNVIPLTTSAALTTGTTVGLTVIIVPP